MGAQLTLAALLCFISAASLSATDFAAGQTADESTVENEMKWLAGEVEGANPEVGYRLNYDRYKYEDFDYEDCSIKLRETREFYEKKKLVSRTVRDITLPLSSLNLTSLRVDKLGPSLYSVSFTANGQKSWIGAREKVIYPDGSEEQSYGGSTGYGFLFWTSLHRASRTYRVSQRYSFLSVRTELVTVVTG